MPANFAAAKFLAIPAAVGSNDGFAAASFVAAKVVEARVAASFVANVALVVAVPLASCVGTIAAAFAASGHFVGSIHWHFHPLWKMLLSVL